MKVTVELQTYLQQYSPDGKPAFEHTLPDGATVQTLVRGLGLPEEMASVIIVNEAIAAFSDPLHEGDKVTLIPPLAGGWAPPTGGQAQEPGPSSTPRRSVGRRSSIR